ncbi:hypothetical protein Tco_1171800, partial [Tanacetum coccineum]
KKKKRQDSPKTPPGSPPHPPPPPPPPPGPSGTSRASSASGLSHSTPPPPPPSNTQGGQSTSTATPSSSKTIALVEYTAWTTTDTSVKPSISSIPAELLMDDDTTADEQAYSSSGEDIGHDHIPTASALKSTYAPLPENSLLAQTGDMATFMDWYNVSKPLPLGSDPGHVIIQPDLFFNKDLEYLRYSRKISKLALSLSKMKATYYPDVGLEQMVPDQMWINEECKYNIAAIAVRTHMRILSVIRIEVFSLYGYNYMKKIVLRHADLKEYVIAERDFKYLYPSNFEDLNLVIRQRVEDFQLGIESYQTDVTFSDGTLHQIDEALDYRVKEFRVNRRNPCLDTQF